MLMFHLNRIFFIRNFYPKSIEIVLYTLNLSFGNIAFSRFPVENLRSSDLNDTSEFVPFYRIYFPLNRILGFFIEENKMEAKI